MKIGETNVSSSQPFAMFTGIVREVGRLIDVTRQGSTSRICIEAPQTFAEAELGDSICSNGTCLTVTDLKNERFSADLSSETLSRTTFQTAHPGMWVNVEPALRPIDRMGGHIVTGHVDGIGTIERLEEDSAFWRMTIRFPLELTGYIAQKGSLCVDGVSLTVAAIDNNRASFAIVPFTIQKTNLRAKHPGDSVNLEIDILARYVERLMKIGENPCGSGLSLETLRQYGFASE